MWLAEEWFSPGWRAGHRRAVLSGASAARAARAAHHARASRAATRAGSCASCAMKPGTRSTMPIACAAASAGARCSVPPRCPYPRPLQGAPRQPPLRASPGRVVRAGASDRGFRRDLRGLAEAELGLAQQLCRLAGVPQAAARRGAHGERARQAPAGAQPRAASSPSTTTRARWRSTTGASWRATTTSGAALPTSCCRGSSAAERRARQADARRTLLRAHKHAMLPRGRARARRWSATACSRSCAC